MPSSRTCARSTPCWPLRSSVLSVYRLVLWFTHWRAGGLLRAAERAVDRGDERRRAFLPAALAEASSRSVTASISTSSRVPPPREGPGTRLLSLGRYLDRERARRRARGCCTRRARMSGFGIHRPVALRRRARAPQRARARPRPSSGSTDESCSAMRFRAPSLPGLFAEHDALVNNMRSGASRQSRIRGRGRMPSGACLEPVLRLAPRSEHRFPRHRSTRARGQDPGSGET